MRLNKANVRDLTVNDKGNAKRLFELTNQKWTCQAIYSETFGSGK